MCHHIKVAEALAAMIYEIVKQWHLWYYCHLSNQDCKVLHDFRLCQNWREASLGIHGLLHCVFSIGTYICCLNNSTICSMSFLPPEVPTRLICSEKIPHGIPFYFSCSIPVPPILYVVDCTVIDTSNQSVLLLALSYFSSCLCGLPHLWSCWSLSIALLCWITFLLERLFLYWAEIRFFLISLPLIPALPLGLLDYTTFASVPNTTIST